MTNLNPQQFALFPESAVESPAETRNRRVPVGGQLELPLREDLRTPSRSTSPPPPRQEDRLKAGEHPVDVYHGGTYPMLMTGPEVRHQFQALDGDRRGGADSWTRETKRPSFTASQRWARMNTDGGWKPYLTGEHVPAEHLHVLKPPRDETDDELYSRKLDEAYHPAWGRLALEIHKHGFDLAHPVSLSTGAGGYDDSGGRGSQGKYQVLGGHHRVAVMGEELPRQFMSVQWAPDIGSARRSPTY